MAQPPPKIPTMAPAWPEFGSGHHHSAHARHHHHQRIPSTGAFLAESMPPLPPPPSLLLLVPVGLMAVLVALAFVPSDSRSIASSCH